MRSLILALLLLTSAAAQNGTTDPTDPGTTDPTGTQGPESTQDGAGGDGGDATAWWGRAEVQRGVSGVALVALVVAFVMIARK